jgi:hypothetical protein
MPTWQLLIFIAMAGCMIGCLWRIFNAIERLTNCIDSVGIEFRKMNAKLERIEIAAGDDSQRPMDQQDFDAEAIDAIEAALSNFENLKRIDLTNPQGSNS